MIRRARIQEAELTYSLCSTAKLESVHGPVHELLGYAAEDFLSGNASFQARIHPHDSDIIQSLFSADGEENGMRVLRFRHGGGRILCLQVQFKKDRGADEIVLHLQI